MAYKKRVETLRILISGHPTLMGSPRLDDIVTELNRLTASSRFPSRNWLLTVLYTTRALDTTLFEAVRIKGWAQTPSNLGRYLRILEEKAILLLKEREHYQTKVVDERNKYMHQAGAMPTKIDADGILAEMHACVVRVLGQV
jgi:hypothetical protein